MHIIKQNGFFIMKHGVSGPKLGQSPQNKHISLGKLYLNHEPWGLQAKQGKMEEMTAGQATTLSRNEQVIDAATQEMEDLEDDLNASIAQSLRGKRKKMQPEASKKRRCPPPALHFLPPTI